MSQIAKGAWVEQLYTAHRTEVFRLCLVILRDVHLAEDALQDTFLKAQQTTAQPKPGKERAWLMAIARNTAYGELRRQSRELPAEEETIQRSLERDSAWEYTALLDGLSELDRDIVTLHIIGGLTHKEIARVLKLNVAGEKKRYERALEKLRRQLKEDGT